MRTQANDKRIDVQFRKSGRHSTAEAFASRGWCFSAPDSGIHSVFVEWQHGKKKDVVDSLQDLLKSEELYECQCDDCCDANGAN